MTGSNTLKQYISALESAAGVWASSMSLQMSLKEEVGTQTLSPATQRPHLREAGTNTQLLQYPHSWGFQSEELGLATSQQSNGAAEVFKITPNTPSRSIVRRKYVRRTQTGEPAAIATQVRRRGRPRKVRPDSNMTTADNLQLSGNNGSPRETQRTCALLARQSIATAARRGSQHRHVQHAIKLERWETLKKERARYRMLSINAMRRAVCSDENSYKNVAETCQYKRDVAAPKTYDSLSDFAYIDTFHASTLPV